MTAARASCKFQSDHTIPNPYLMNEILLESLEKLMEGLMILNLLSFWLIALHGLARLLRMVFEWWFKEINKVHIFTFWRWVRRYVIHRTDSHQLPLPDALIINSVWIKLYILNKSNFVKSPNAWFHPFTINIHALQSNSGGCRCDCIIVRDSLCYIKSCKDREQTYWYCLWYWQYVTEYLAI